MEDNIDREKSLFLTQIKFLDEELERCQLECDALEARNKDLPALCSTLQDDRTDISEYLKLLVVEKEAEAEEVKKRLENQLQVEEADREAVRLQHGRQMEELQQRLDELQCDSRRTAAASSETLCEEQQEQQEQQELEELEELEEQLRQQQADLDSVRQQLLSVRKATAASLGSNNDKPWSSWKLRVPRAVKASSDKLIWNIVQEEREEHGELRGPFQLLLEENEELWGKKKELRDQERVHHSDMERERRRLQEATNKKLSYRKEEEQLTRQCQQLQKELRRCSTASESLQEEEEALRALLASASELCHQRSLDLAALRAELQQESSRRRRLEGVTQEGVSALRLLLTDSRRPSAARWRRLLGVLEAPVPQRPDSAPGQKPEPEPEARRAEAPSFATDPLFLMARYRPGDLGLVPRPSWTQGASACRTGAQQSPAGPISDSLWSPAPFPASTQWSPAPPPASTQISPAPPPASTQRSPATAGGETSVSNLKASAAAHVRPHSY